MVFDVLAMLQDGISTVTSLSKETANSTGENKQLSGGFGLSEAVASLVQINLSKSSGKTSEASQKEVHSEERIHTPASLLYRLRNLIEESGCFNQNFADIDQIRVGDFIEVEGMLKINPALDSFQAWIEILGTVNAAKQLSAHQKPKGAKQTSSTTKIHQKLSEWVDHLTSGNNIDLCMIDLNTGINCVITVTTGLLADPGLRGVVDGQFKVLGKVVQCVSDEDESISFLRTSSLKRFDSEFLEITFGSLATITENSKVTAPKFESEISGPAVQVIPIAIYA